MIRAGIWRTVLAVTVFLILLPTMAAATAAIEGLARGHRHTGTWTLAQMLNHAAQSIDYSIDGFPEMKSALFRGAVGSVAFAVFQARGKMGHTLDEPIPGAPALDAQAPLEPAIKVWAGAVRAEAVAHKTARRRRFRRRKPASSRSSGRRTGPTRRSPTGR